MIGMPIAPIRPKGNHHIRAEAADVFDHLPGQLFSVNVLECPVLMIQTHDPLYTKSLARLGQYLFTHRPKRAAHGDMRAANLSGLSSRCGHHHHLRTTGDILCKGAPCAKSFVVGMGENTQDAGHVFYRQVVH